MGADTNGTCLVYSRLSTSHNRLQLNPETNLVQGNVYTPQTFVHVNWNCVAILASQLFLPLFFLIATALRMRAAGSQFSKGPSPLATTCGFDADVRQLLGELRDFEKLERRARDMKVRFHRSNSGATLLV